MDLIMRFLDFYFWKASLAPRERCIPTAVAYGPCHVCVCGVDGVYYCRAHACEEVSEECDPYRTYREEAAFCTCSQYGHWISNNCREKFRSMIPNQILPFQKVKTNIKCTPNSTYLLDSTSIRRFVHEELPEIPEGAPCFPGKIYRKECNTCRCTSANSLICTKMSCLSKKDMDRVKETVKQQKKIEKQKKEEKERIKIKAEKAKMQSRWVQELPEGECVPGKLYEKDCRGCYCYQNKTALCVKQKNTCDKNFYPESADAIRPILSEKDFYALPSLPHIAAKCVPGKAYRVDCNSCVCLINHSLMCDLAMCLSYEDMLRTEAERSLDKNCTKGKKVESPDECVKCSCSKDGKTKCEVVPGCQPGEEARRRIHGGNDKKKPKLALHFNDKDKCVGGTIYKLHCNRCFCQQDGTMRCTQKTCLTYAQALMIQKHRLYLQRHNL
ncbi:hypothetical protein ABMA27_008854 [Loxostege sticticalis]|uniref:Pacifastin domain-containing protein n=1 Tax=Loxostege sticticalis TaxID=481309 RepID=A0ABR3H924_LOXSC